MHNYNVDHKYQYGCRLGNWSEEQDLEDHKMKEYLKKKEQQKLVCGEREDKLAISLSAAELTYSEDGFIHNNFCVQLHSDFMNSVVAINPSERISSQEEAYAITAAQSLSPVLRNVFRIARLEKDILHNDDVLRYGQNIRFVLASTAGSQSQLYLSSVAISPQRLSKFSKKQEVCLSVDTSSNSLWCLEYTDPKLRYEMKGEAVRPGEPVLIKHVPTSQWLASDRVVYGNQFEGTEFEVFCNSFSTHNKTQNLIAEKVGRKTIETPMRNQSNQNTFRIITAIDPPKKLRAAYQATTAPTVTTLAPATTTASSFFANNKQQQSHPNNAKTDLVTKLRRQLTNKAGVYALHHLRSALISADTMDKGKLDVPLLRQTLQLIGLPISEIDLIEVSTHFTVEGFIDYPSLLLAIRGETPAARTNLINRAYDAVSDRLGGNVTLSGILNVFEKQKHPDVIKRYITEKEALSDFLHSWGSANRHSAISRDQFQAYYKDFSACVDREDYFEVVLKNVWKIPS